MAAVWAFVYHIAAINFVVNFVLLRHFLLKSFAVL